MATYSFDLVKDRFTREFTSNSTVNKVIDAALDAAEYLDKNADTIVLCGAMMLLGDITDLEHLSRD